MKFRLFPFTRDLRSDDQKKRYQTLEQKRADAYLAMAIARNQRARMYGYLPQLPSLMRRQDNFDHRG